MILFLIASLGFWFFRTSCKAEEEKDKKLLDKKISELADESVFLRFKVVERDESSLRVAMKFYDLDGNVIRKIEPTLKMRNLVFDFIYVKICKQTLIFPYQLFVDSALQERNFKIFPLYEKNDFPNIFYTENKDSFLKKQLSEIFELVKSDDMKSLNEKYDTAFHARKTIFYLREKEVYKIIFRKKGIIEICQE